MDNRLQIGLLVVRLRKTGQSIILPPINRGMTAKNSFIFDKSKLSSKEKEVAANINRNMQSTSFPRFEEMPDSKRDNKPTIPAKKVG